jgi:hypothetical protein
MNIGLLILRLTVGVIAIDEDGLALVGLTLSGAPTTAYIEVGGVRAAEACPSPKPRARVD